MAELKTRQLLIDVARTVFGKKGVNNVTMNDIALASGKGRRTIYNYFKNKDELYFAVMETELDRLNLNLEKLVRKRLNPRDKLINYLFTRLEAIRNVVERNGKLKAAFFQNVEKVALARRSFDYKQIDSITEILTEGVNKKVFDIYDIKLTAKLLHYSLKGLEIPYIRGRIPRFGETAQQSYIIDFIFHGILKQ